jgi:hypothetical protein
MGERHPLFTFLIFPLPNSQPSDEDMILRSKPFLIALAVLATIALLAVLRFKPWQRGHNQGVEGSARQQLAVGFLPVT